MNLAGEEIHFEVKNNNSFKFNIFAFMMYSLIEIIEYFKKMEGTSSESKACSTCNTPKE